jgi:hypothetical protein
MILQHPVLSSYIIISCLYSNLSSEVITLIYHSVISSFVIISCFHPSLSSQVITLSYNPKLLSQVIIPCIHPHNIIPCYHTMFSPPYNQFPSYRLRLSPNIIITFTCYHPMLSTSITITCFHSRLSLHIGISSVTLCYYRILSPRRN